MKKYKSNPYNVLIPVEERKEFLLYNTLTGGIEILNQHEGSYVGELESLSSFEKSKVPEKQYIFEYLKEREYILDDIDDLVSVFESHIEENQFKNASTIHLTIGTTITCNMGCSYCFEFVKPNNTLKNEEVMKGTADYINQILTKSDKPIETLSVTWYGGEPLINVKAIIIMSKLFIDLSKKHNIKYNANIITNGIYLSDENIQHLIDGKVSNIQVTIDGAREIHDKKRPLKQKKGENYFKILRNLSRIPSSSGMTVDVRINVDKEVASSVDLLLDDFHEYGIWPQKYKQIHFDAAWLRSYEEIELSENEEDKRMFVDEFFEFKQEFRLKLIDRFNIWALSDNSKKAKLKWDLPTYQSTCATWASPISLVVDPNGNIHKCWETIHDDDKATSTVFDEYSPDVYTYFTSFNRYNHNEVCRSCKFLPVCDKISCSHEAIKNVVPQCTEWKYKTSDYLKEQYLRMISAPHTINRPESVDAINTGHSNK